MNVPKLRFPEFRDMNEWEERLVDEFFTVGSSKRILQEDWTNHGVPFYRTRELVSLSKGEPFKSEIFISEATFLEISQKYGLPSGGDFLVSGVGTLGISYQVQAGDRFYFKDGNVLWFKIKKKLVSNYFKYCFQSDKIQNQILGQASISTVGTYTIQNAKKTKFWYPLEINEQQKIADCLSSLDELVTAETQTLEAYKQHKKGLMQQLFPQTGETTPRLRFPEFQEMGEWDIKPLGEICHYWNGTSHEAAVTENGEYYLVSLNSINIDGNLKPDMKRLLETDNSLQENDLVMVLSDVAHGNFLGLTDIIPSSKFVLNQRMAGLRIRTSVAGSVSYLRAVINNTQKYFKQNGQGSSQLNLAKSAVTNFPVLFPSPEEQQKIANCLSSLDGLITAQSQKIEMLKQHKKGLMQGLFPSVEEVGQ